MIFIILAILLELVYSINQIVLINSTDFVVIQLRAIELNLYQANYIKQYIGEATNGQVYQTSWVFSNYNYTPIKGSKIKSKEYLLDTKSRFVYKPNKYFNYKQIDKITWLVTGLKTGLVTKSVTKPYGDTTSIINVHILPITKQIVSSNFLLDDESWTISGSNPLKPSGIKYWNYNGGFITGSEDYINVDYSEIKHTYSIINRPDKSLWYFKAPNKYYQNLAISYGGFLEFKLIELTGDFNSNINMVPIVKLNSPLISLGYYNKTKFKNHWLIQLVPDNFLPKVSPNQFTNLLEQINGLEILGDWTQGYETVGLDSVLVKAK